MNTTSPSRKPCIRNDTTRGKRPAFKSHSQSRWLAAAALPAFERTLRDDGAFSMGGDVCLQDHGGLRLAPAKRQSDAPGTDILVNAIALLANLCGLRDALGWTPTTEARMKLRRISR